MLFRSDGLIIYGNMSSLNSEAYFPHNVTSVDPVTWKTARVDTVRKSRLPGQANNIYNLAIGYDKGRFSGRISYYFQGHALEVIRENEMIDTWSDDFARVDAAMTYRFMDSVSFVATFNNILNRRDKSYAGNPEFPISEVIYGWRGNFGFRFTF